MDERMEEGRENEDKRQGQKEKGDVLEKFDTHKIRGVNYG